MAAGRNVYYPNDLSGAAFDCLTSNCRLIQAIGLEDSKITAWPAWPNAQTLASFANGENNVNCAPPKRDSFKKGFQSADIGERDRQSACCENYKTTSGGDRQSACCENYKTTSAGDRQASACKRTDYLNLLNLRRAICRT
jgi:hypothetical protein